MPHLRRTMPHLRAQNATSATPPCAICDASMCDLHRVQLTTLDARCSGGRPLPRCRAVVAGGRCRSTPSLVTRRRRRVTFCVPVRGARQRARLPAVQTTSPAAPGALYGAFAPPQAATRSPTASSACGCRPPHARRLRVRHRPPHAARPPGARLTPASCVCAGFRASPKLCLPYSSRAGASRGA